MGRSRLLCGFSDHLAAQSLPQAVSKNDQVASLVSLARRRPPAATTNGVVEEERRPLGILSEVGLRWAVVNPRIMGGGRISSI